MNCPLDITRMWASQNDLRNVRQIAGMILDVRSGRYFTQDELQAHSPNKLGCQSMITITCFPDGQTMTHDGHHRLVSIWLGGRATVRGDEYRMNSFTYSDYTDINLKAGWFTPFDPLRDIRLCNFGFFKDEVTRLLAEAPNRAEEYILGNPDLYRAPRDIRTIPELAAKIESRLTGNVSPQIRFRHEESMAS